MQQLKIVYLFILFGISFPLFSQNNTPLKEATHTLSANDSVLLKRYLKGYQNNYLYSNDYQLYLDSVLTIVPWRAFYWQQKGMPLCKQKKYEIGMPYLDSAVKYDNNKHYLEYRAFMKCIFQKSYRAAIIDFEAAKKQNGFAIVMDHSYDFYMGLSYLQLNNFDMADSLIKSSIDWSTKNGVPLHYLEYLYWGIVKMEKKQDTLAINMFDMALKLSANLPDAKYYKALCLENLGKIKEAKQSMTEGLDDINKGYSNNEDNAIYEEYPYQKRKYSFEQHIKYYDKLISVTK